MSAPTWKDHPATIIAAIAAAVLGFCVFCGVAVGLSVAVFRAITGDAP